MPDVLISLGSFNTGTAEVVAVSDAGKALFSDAFGLGAVSAKMPKSRAPEFAAHVEGKGLSVDWQ